MTYARARLWLGISGVGFFVTSSAAALWFDLPRRLLAGRSTLPAIALTFAVYIVLSFPFDLLGGHLLPHRYHRPHLNLPSWLQSWLRGVFSQTLIMGASALILLQAGRHGTLIAIAAFVLLMLSLIQAQLAIASLVGGLRRSTAPLPATPNVAGHPHKHPQTLLYRSTDPAFVGGLVGLPGRERLILPAAWLEDLPPEVVQMQITRRLGALATGTRTRGLGLALLWNLAGFTLATQLPRADVVTVPGLVDIGLWCTLWSFVGLLLLPTLNRPGVLEADRFALASGLAADRMQPGMIALDRLQDDEPSRSRWIERVFHPIPSVESRAAALGHDHSRFGAWQGARITLYLSWTCFGFLARAVHCNVGRPELWVLFPGD